MCCPTRMLLSLGLAWLLALAFVPGIRVAAEEPVPLPGQLTPGEKEIRAKLKLTQGPLTAEQEQITRQFAKIWFARLEGIFSNSFLGVPTIQNPLDVWITQEILFEVKPDFVIEAGTYHGGSALLWAMFLEQIKPSARVITIDIRNQRARTAREHRLAKKVDFLQGSSTAPEIVTEVTRRVKGKSALVILDSLHTPEHVSAELDSYAPLVPVGSYIIVQDMGVGPEKAVLQFLEGRDDFVVDTTRERLLLTNNGNGFLRRVK